MYSVVCLCVLVVSVAAAPTVGPVLKGIFDALDLNKDGHLTLSEFNQFYDTFDKDGDGQVSLADYIAASKLPKDQAQPLFNNYDQDKDGSVTKKDVAKIFSDYDGNGDGQVTTGEFVKHYSETRRLC